MVSITSLFVHKILFELVLWLCGKINYFKNSKHIFNHYQYTETQSRVLAALQSVLEGKTFSPTGRVWGEPVTKEEDWTSSSSLTWLSRLLTEGSVPLSLLVQMEKLQEKGQRFLNLLMAFMQFRSGNFFKLIYLIGAFGFIKRVSAPLVLVPPWLLFSGCPHLQDSGC